MNKKISQLNEATTLTDADVLPIVNGAETKKVSIATIKEQVTVNADWEATSGKAEILNKPTIPNISGLELQANKQNNLDIDGSGTKYPTVDAVNAGLIAVNTDRVDRVTVKLATAINKGQAVYVSSASGTNIIVSKASNTSELTSSKTIGLLETTGAINAIVNVITDGILTGLNTLSATIGDPVWLGVNGDLIYGLINKPFAPAHLVYIGVVTRVNENNGEILVKVQNGFELKEIHDVDLITTTPTNNQGLLYDSATSLWKNKSVLNNDINQRLNGYTVSNEFINKASNGTWDIVYFLGGSLNFITPPTNHFGVLGVQSFGTTGAGCNITTYNATNNASIILIPNLQTDLIFQTASIINSSYNLRFGFNYGTANSSNPTNGIYFKLNGNSIVGENNNGSILSNTSSVTLTDNTYYHLRIKVISTSAIRYDIYAMDGTLINSQTLTTNIPLGVLNCSVTMWNNASTTVQFFALDYIGITIPPMPRGALT